MHIKINILFLRSRCQPNLGSFCTHLLTINNNYLSYRLKQKMYINGLSTYKAPMCIQCGTKGSITSSHNILYFSVLKCSYFFNYYTKYVSEMYLITLIYFNTFKNVYKVYCALCFMLGYITI